MTKQDAIVTFLISFVGVAWYFNLPHRIALAREWRRRNRLIRGPGEW